MTATVTCINYYICARRRDGSHVWRWEGNDRKKAIGPRRGGSRWIGPHGGRIDAEAYPAESVVRMTEITTFVLVSEAGEDV